MQFCDRPEQPGSAGDQSEGSRGRAGARTQAPEQRQDRICSGICSAEAKTNADMVQVPPINKQRISIALIKHDPEAFDSLQAASDVACNKTGRPGGLSRFVKVYNGQELRSKPSFVVLEDALVRKRIEQNPESQSPVSSVPQESAQIKIEPPTEQSPPKESPKESTKESPKESLAQSSGSGHRTPNRFNTVQSRKNAGLQPLQTSRLEGEAKVASSSTLMPEATAPRPSAATNTHQPREEQQQAAAAMGSTPSHVTISFVPATPAQSVNPMMYPCQQYLNNMAIRCLSGNCCNCCPLKPPVRQAAPEHGCCNCSSCCALSHQESEQQQQQQQQQQYPIAGWYPYPPCAPGHGMHQCFCQPMTTVSMNSNCCRMNAAYHQPCPHCGSFYNSPQMQQQQHKPQQHQETQNVACGNQRQRRGYTIKRPKVPDSSDASSSPVNREGLRRMFGPSSSQQQQSQAKQHQQLKPSVGRAAKESTAIPAKEASRSLAGSAAVRHDTTTIGGKQSTSLYMARFGRTCMLMKPSASSLMPRLLTRRISRYTSVMAWPTNHKSELT
ncbi:mediator of RNA polymerase II transcription subunit 15 [Drosophila obscura]|uniref:mediator of RNA polymerase II transcription subunit 15 n=1 Tax=Drosophila obscura TaxID=7282 RepID=UPI001BB19A62|nr:mediator of RNA polymerase II transcription subunit 15 [Drosophila obscura]